MSDYIINQNEAWHAGFSLGFLSGFISAIVSWGFIMFLWAVVA